MPSLVKKPIAKNPNRRVWRGNKMVNGKMMFKLFPDDSEKSRKAAIIWESEAEKELKGEKPKEEPAQDSQQVMISLGQWANEYLDYVKISFSEGVYKEKQSVFKRFFSTTDYQLPVSHLTRSTVMAYIMNQKKLRSGYAANKDRKNLVAGWNWGMKYLDPPLPGPNPCMVEKWRKSNRLDTFRLKRISGKFTTASMVRIS